MALAFRLPVGLKAALHKKGGLVKAAGTSAIVSDGCCWVLPGLTGVPGRKVTVTT